MASKLLALICAIVALLMVSAVSSPADARREGRSSGYSGSSHHSGGYARSYGSANFQRFRAPAYSAQRSYDGPHRRVHRHRHIFIGAPFIYDSYYGYGSGDCYWLRRRALYTGSPYWWNRYRACLAGYGY